ncbi:MAG: flavodoxin domain-containing protein [Candidatus Omnitrophota bacterium]
MRTLIVYMTTHGATEKTAEILKSKLKGDVSLVNLKKNKPKDLSGFDTIVIGGSIHIGKIQKGITTFISRHLDTLKQKKLGLFVCCMAEGDEAQKEFDAAFPEELRAHATATGFFGGEFNFEKMNFIYRAMIRKVAKVNESVSKLKEENISRFADALNR